MIGLHSLLITEIKKGFAKADARDSAIDEGMRELDANGVIILIKWLRTAKNLEVATGYLAKNDSKAAQKMYAHIRKSVEALGGHPGQNREDRWNKRTGAKWISIYSAIPDTRKRGADNQVFSPGGNCR